MRRFFETSIWAWTVYTIILFVLANQFIDFPEWKDSFWSGWAQTVGSIGAVYAAIRVGRVQIEAAERLKAREVNAAQQAAMTMARQGIAEAASAIQGIVDQPLIQTEVSLRAICVDMLRQAISTLEEALKSQLPVATRERVWRARQTSFRVQRVIELFSGPLADSDCAAMRAASRRSWIPKRGSPWRRRGWSR